MRFAPGNAGKKKPKENKILWKKDEIQRGNHKN
jgi:hypothetical protein